MKTLVQHELLEALDSSPDLGECFAAVVKAFSRDLPIDRAAIASRNDAEGYLILHEVFDKSAATPFPKNSRLPVSAVPKAWRMDGIDPYVLSDLSAVPAPSDMGLAFLARGLRSVMVFSVISGGKAIGAVSLASETAGVFSEDKIGSYRKIAKAVNGALARTLLLAEQQELGRRYQILLRAGKAISESASDKKQILIALREIKRVVPLDFGVVMRKSRSGRLEELAFIGTNTDLISTAQDAPARRRKAQQAPYSGSDWAASHRAALSRVDISSGDGPSFPGDDVLNQAGIKSHVVVPLNFGGKLVGTLEAGSTAPYVYGSLEVEMLQLIGSQAMAALRNAELIGELSAARDEWEKTFDAIPDLITIHDCDHRILKANLSAREMMKQKGKHRAEGSRCFEFCPSGNAPCPECPHEIVMMTKEPHSAEIQGFAEEGRVYFVSCAPLFDEEGEVAASVHLARDMTERHLLEEQLRHSDKMAALGELISGVAHELNNPLATIMGNSQLINMETGEEKIRSRAQTVFRQSERAAAIVSNLLSFARRGPVEKACISMNDVVRRTLELWAFNLKSGQTRLQLDLSDDLPCIMADFFQMQQVVLNVLNNAKQAIEGAGVRKGEIVVSTGTELDGCCEKLVVLSIADNGPGIDAEAMPRLFDPFFTTKPAGEGTGLGLSIVYGLMESHDGSVTAENREGGGAVFTIKLKAAGESVLACSPYTIA